MKKPAIILALVFMVFCIGYYLFYPYYTTHIAVEKTFVIDHNIEEVRKVLVRTDVGKQLAETLGAKILEAKWDKVTLGIGELTRPGKTWDLTAHGELKVRIDNKYVKDPLLLCQKSYVKPNLVISKISLVKTVGPLTGYENNFKFSEYGDKTKVQVQLYTKIGRRIPNIPGLRDIIYERLENQSKERLDQSEKELRRLIKKNIGKALLLQLPMGGD
jgi:hypothetical protein